MVGPKSNVIYILLKRENLDMHTPKGRMPCEDEHRDQVNAAEKTTPKIASKSTRSSDTDMKLSLPD